MLINIPDDTPSMDLIKFAAEQGCTIVGNENGCEYALMPTAKRSQALQARRDYWERRRRARNCTISVESKEATFTPEQVRGLIKQINYKIGAGLDSV